MHGVGMPPLASLYRLLHQMLRESGFGANVFPLIGCNGVLVVKVAFRARAAKPSLVPEGDPLVFTVRGAVWLRAELSIDGAL